MKKMKRVLALALALTLCLGLAATVFAALPSYDVDRKSYRSKFQL